MRPSIADDLRARALQMRREREARPPGGRHPLRASAALLPAGVIATAVILGPTTTSRSGTRERHPRTSWAACNRNARRHGPSTFRPLSDAAAAALVTHEPETRPLNARPYRVGGVRRRAVNDDVPTAAQLRRFHHARTSSGGSLLSFNPYLRFVDGRDHLRHPSTDDLIQWSAHKWGIPENWLRAEYVQESYWSQFWLGDEHRVPRSWYRRYPSQARIAQTDEVYRSMGITQVQWTPDGALGPGSEPLRWQSTAFNLDYQAAMVRFYFDNPGGRRSAWGDPSYRPCQPWASIGGWYRPYPWGNADQAGYVARVQADLRDRAWSSAQFRSWSPSSLPPGVRLR